MSSLLMSSQTQERMMAYAARGDGRPTRSLMSALSTKARSTRPDRLLVVNTTTFGCVLSWSSCVSMAFTTLMASEGSFPGKQQPHFRHYVFTGKALNSDNGLILTLNLHRSTIFRFLIQGRKKVSKWRANL